MLDGILIAIVGFSTMFAALSMPLALEFEGVQAFMIGPGFLPAIFGGVLGILGLIRAACMYKRKNAVKTRLADAIRDNREKIVRYIVMIIIFGAFVFLVGKVPFRVITLGYFAVFYIFVYFEKITQIRVIGKIACLSVCGTLFLAYFLPALLQIPLP